MWHHLERSDIKAQGEALCRSGALDLNYYDLSPEEKLRDLIDRVFPFSQTWVATWLNVADTSPALECHINRFENFAADQQGALRAMLAFFGHDIDPVVPDIDDARDAGIHAQTHFRRGQVGSYRDEAPAELVQLFEERLDRGLAVRMGWI